MPGACMVPTLLPHRTGSSRSALQEGRDFVRFEEEIKKSRFITSVARVDSREAALSFVCAMREEFPDARHNCWAYAAGAPGDTAKVGQSDDGEPHGTAGRPMLAQLLHGGIGEVAAVTTRYFGGIKLGTGGLARAYQNGVKEALALLSVEEKTVTAWLSVSLEYGDCDRFHRLLPRFRAFASEESFESRACFKIGLPSSEAGSFSLALREATDGRCMVAPWDGDGGLETACLDFSTHSGSMTKKTAATEYLMSNPMVLIETSSGDILVELYADKAPATVENFLRYVDEDFYSNTIFHRVIKGFMIQGGGLGVRMDEKPVHAPVANEAGNGLSNKRGTIAMARTSDPNSAAAQFFINLVDNAELDHVDDTPEGFGYCVFGAVEDGMDVVDRIAKLKVKPQGEHEAVPVDMVVITKISRFE